MEPVISVIMTVYNTEKYLRESIESILNQTYSNFEFIIINDASTDNSKMILDSYQDSRIIRIDNARNLGASQSSNIGLDRAKGKYIARMDSDDISKPERFAIQYKYLEDNPDVAILGSWLKTCGDREEIWKYSDNHVLNRSRLLFNPPVAHSSILIRKSIIDKYQIKYNTAFTSAIDYELYSQFPDHIKFSNIQEVLYFYRIHESQMSTTKREEQQKFADTVRWRMLSRFQIDLTNEEKILHRQVSLKKIDTIESLKACHGWLLKLLEANELFSVYPHDDFTKLLSDYWLQLCNQLSYMGGEIWRLFFESTFSKHIALPEATIDLNKLVAFLNEEQITQLSIFGTGRMGYFLANELMRNNMTIKYFLDNHIQAQDLEIHGIPIVKPNKYNLEEVDAVILSILGKHDEFIINHLNHLHNGLTIYSWKNFCVKEMMLDDAIII